MGGSGHLWINQLATWPGGRSSGAFVTSSDGIANSRSRIANRIEFRRREFRSRCCGRFFIDRRQRWDWGYCLHYLFVLFLTNISSNNTIMVGEQCLASSVYAIRTMRYHLVDHKIFSSRPAKREMVSSGGFRKWGEVHAMHPTQAISHETSNNTAKSQWTTLFDGGIWDSMWLVYYGTNDDGYLSIVSVVWWIMMNSKLYQKPKSRERVMHHSNIR